MIKPVNEKREVIFWPKNEIFGFHGQNLVDGFLAVKARKQSEEVSIMLQFPERLRPLVPGYAWIGNNPTAT